MNTFSDKLVFNLHWLVFAVLVAVCLLIWWQLNWVWAIVSLFVGIVVGVVGMLLFFIKTDWH